MGETKTSPMDGQGVTEVQEEGEVVRDLDMGTGRMGEIRHSPVDTGRRGQMSPGWGNST